MSVSAAEEAEDPACIPIFWVSKWVDYSDKYGLGRCLPGRWGAQVRLRAPASCYGLWPFLAPRFSALNTLLSPSQLPVLPPCSPLPLSEVSLHLPLGYQLCDNSVGVLFNDSTRLILYNDGDSLQYIERDGTESYLTVSSHPNSLIKKVSAAGRAAWLLQGSEGCARADGALTLDSLPPSATRSLSLSISETT